MGFYIMGNQEFLFLILPSHSYFRSYIVTTSSSKQNLDSIVEAIRHLEGDHLFTTPESATVTVSSSGEVAGPQQVQYTYIFQKLRNEFSSRLPFMNRCRVLDASSLSSYTHISHLVHYHIGGRGRILLGKLGLAYFPG